jgi:hypothetical protein
MMPRCYTFLFPPPKWEVRFPSDFSIMVAASYADIFPFDGIETASIKETSAGPHFTTITHFLQVLRRILLHLQTITFRLQSRRRGDLGKHWGKSP